MIHLRRHVVAAGPGSAASAPTSYDGSDAAERIRALRDEWEARDCERRAQIDADIRAASCAAAQRRAGRRTPPRDGRRALRRHRRIAFDCNVFIYLFEVRADAATVAGSACSDAGGRRTAS